MEESFVKKFQSFQHLTHVDGSKVIVSKVRERESLAHPTAPRGARHFAPARVSTWLLLPVTVASWDVPHVAFPIQPHMHRTTRPCAPAYSHVCVWRLSLLVFWGCATVVTICVARENVATLRCGNDAATWQFCGNVAILWQRGGVQSVQEDRKRLKSAKKDGKLHGELLNRRAKLKHDKFC
jgi:hypothetical protein